MDSRRQVLRTYERLRLAGRALNSRLVESLPRQAVDECGRRLGILRRGALVLDSEDEMAVLFDHAIYDWRDRQGRNAVETFLRQAPPSEGSDEALLLEAMTRATFSIFQVAGAERGVGIHLRDILRGEDRFLVDVNLSLSASAGLLIAARVIEPAGLAMTTGAGVPVVGDAGPKLAEYIEGHYGGPGAVARLGPEDRGKLSAFVLKTCLAAGGAASVRYGEPGDADELAPPPPRAALDRKVGRNDPCPCGSGLKYKKCCGIHER